jgi:hypothetical protein
MAPMNVDLATRRDAGKPAWLSAGLARAETIESGERGPGSDDETIRAVLADIGAVAPAVPRCARN